MILSGLVNKRIVQAIMDAGGRAVGISGKDDDLMVCEADDPELGYVGRPIEMNVQVLRDLYKAGIIPVVAPVATGMADNETFNVNGDTAAGAIAGALQADRLLLLTERSAMEQTLEDVIQGNSAQLADAGFVKELKAWIRFNADDAVRRRDGLYSVCNGNPNIPAWAGDAAFQWIVTAKSENEKVARQVRSSAGIAIFVGQAVDKAHWVEVGRCYERFALQATALGIRNAFLNQPLEVAALRPAFATSLGLTDQRPDLIVRFGRGPAMPRSLRRPVEAVLV
jgi:hypothetical protein